MAIDTAPTSAQTAKERLLNIKNPAPIPVYPMSYMGVGCTEEEFPFLRDSFSMLASDEFSQLDVENKLATLRSKNKTKEPEVASSVEATLAQRGSRYGDFTDHARLCQNLITQLQHFEVPDSGQGHKKEGDKIRITPWHNLDPVKRQALTVICDKIARILSGDPNYDDNWHDIQGYAKLVEDRLPCKQQKES